MNAFAPSRVLAFGLGCFALLNILGDWWVPGFDANVWWIDPRPLPVYISVPFLFCCGWLLLAHALRPNAPDGRARLTRFFLFGLIVIALWNVIVYYRLYRNGEIQTDWPVPFSLAVMLALVIVRRRVGLEHASFTPRDRLVALLTLLFCGGAWPTAHFLTFGLTDYRRSADVAVIFGARAYADGSLSQALDDRVRAGVELYREKHVSFLLMSGGPGDGEIHETEAMRDAAVAMGVPRAAIGLDLEGLNTYATVENTTRLFRERGHRRVLAVSHYFHLPRIKMAYQRAGFEVFTVPAKQAYILRTTPFLIVRESAALWFYYLRPFFPF